MIVNKSILVGTIISWIILGLMTITTTTDAFAVEASSTPPTTLKKKVIVSGAGGQTGQALFRKLLALPQEFQPLGLVRSEASKQALVESGVPEANICIADVTNAESVQAAVASLLASGGEESLYAFCICTSAKPAPTGDMNPETGRPVFHFPNGNPELVDWMGQKNQIDACPSGTHVVLCSTMGGTNPDHPLNNLGKTINSDGTISGGMIVQWKRKAEVYLMEQSPKLKYTIVHPGGLLNEPGGERELLVGVDDKVEGTDSRTVPREDVAQVMLEALRYPEKYAGRSFDLLAKPVGDGTATTDFASLLDRLEGKNCDYTLGATM